MAASKEPGPLPLFSSVGQPPLSKRATGALYAVLRDLARRQLRKSNGGTLNTTALAHEAWIRLERNAEHAFESRAHFLAVAATVMRRVIVDWGRRRRAQRRGSGVPVTSSALSRVVADSNLNVDELLAIDAALDKLEAVNQRLASVVEFRFFAGLEEEEIAQALEVNVRTVRRDWRKARAFLLSEIAPG
jgi:RNA polymerase sigma factor (TIGR02999 family)